MRNAEANADPELGESVEAICRHENLACLRKSGPGPSTPALGAEGFYSSLGIFEPSVAQPPLPLQLFLPLQPLSPSLHPPLPLQEFWPLQACFSFTFELSFFSWSCTEAKEAFPAATTFDAWIAAPLPASRPATAALVIRALLVFVMGNAILP